MNQIEIRLIKQSDNLSLALMIRSIFEEFDAPRTGTVFSDPTTDVLFELFRTPDSVLWVAEMNGLPVGCCGVYPTSGLPHQCAELVKFYLSPEFRGKGIGKLLMEKCIVSAREFGYKQLYIESLPVFSKAISMYKMAGFTKLSAPLGQSAHGSCDVWMLLNL